LWSQRNQLTDTFPDAGTIVLEPDMTLGDGVIQVNMGFGDIDTYIAVHGNPFLANAGSL